MDWAFYGDYHIGLQIPAFQVMQAARGIDSLTSSRAKRGASCEKQPAALGLIGAAQAEQPFKLIIMVKRF